MRKIKISIQVVQHKDQAVKLVELMEQYKKIDDLYELNKDAIDSFTQPTNRPYYVRTLAAGVNIYYQFEDVNSTGTVESNNYNDFCILEDISTRFNELLKAEMQNKGLYMDKFDEQHQTQLEQESQSNLYNMKKEKKDWEDKNGSVAYLPQQAPQYNPQQNAGRIYSREPLPSLRFHIFVPSSDAAQKYQKRANHLSLVGLGLAIVSIFIPGVAGLVLAGIALMLTLAAVYNSSQAKNPDAEPTSCLSCC